MSFNLSFALSTTPHTYASFNICEILVLYLGESNLQTGVWKSRFIFLVYIAYYHNFEDSEEHTFRSGVFTPIIYKHIAWSDLLLLLLTVVASTSQPAIKKVQIYIYREYIA